MRRCSLTITPCRTRLLLLLPIAVAAAAFSPTVHALRHHLPTGNATCLPRERDALLEFKRGITSDPLGVLASWQQGGQHDVDNDCCRWGGVRCNSITGHVLELRLPSKTYGTMLAGQISPSLLSLYHLEYLDLSWNNLTGHMPEFLGHLSNLRYLNLSGVPFSGKVPPQLVAS
ncbi:hypothetical protein QOZ80_7BG0590210 [Eleusine coracana subsp. coracana]|nr:hypothetical protein QOZ80_7BG0590210 [Eleusine coracana subsp. coracana]